MKKGFRHTRRFAVVAVLSVGLLMVVALARSASRSRNGTRLRADREIERAGFARLNALAGFDDSRVDFVRAKVSRFHLRLGGQGTREAALKNLGLRWTRQSQSTSDHGTYTTSSERFAMTSPTSDDWPGIVAIVDALEKLPGAGVRELELKSVNGDLDQASMVLVLDVARGASAEISK
ncbi:MAG TPA: hypothetical protein VFE25_10600 [Opitutaceae bacterium]|jgi:hypothetical protein|nr:hypothetical protein [Opitutaceae bacterium]